VEEKKREGERETERREGGKFLLMLDCGGIKCKKFG
jgi:hypothetical protein